MIAELPPAARSLAVAALLALTPLLVQEAGRKPAQAPPPPQAQEADGVTAQADLDARLERERREMLREHFRLCDLDGNGWISFREAEAALGIERQAYRSYDANRDGRIDAAEFEQRSRELLALLGALEPPRKGLLGGAPPDGPASEGDVLPERRRPTHALAGMLPRPADLVARYDANGSGGLDESELGSLFSELGLKLSADVVAAQMDPDDSGELEARELVALAWLVSKHLPESVRARLPSGEDGPGSDAPPPGPPALPPPRRRTGQLSHFQRLDPTDDGAIDERDLRALLSSSQVGVRLTAVLSAMDRDGDARLSELEFLDALRDPPR